MPNEAGVTSSPMKTTPSALQAAQAAASAAALAKSPGNKKKLEYRRKPVPNTDNASIYSAGVTVGTNAQLKAREPSYMTSLRPPKSPRVPQRKDAESIGNSNDRVDEKQTTPESQVSSQSGSVWNDLNNSSSSSALAAAASIAKTNPSSLVSSASSPKLVKVSNNQANYLTNYKNSTLNDNFNSPNGGTFFDNRQPGRTRSMRKPPPPPRTSSVVTEISESSVEACGDRINQNYDSMNAASNISINNVNSDNNKSPVLVQQQSNPDYHLSFNQFVKDTNKTSTPSQKLTNFFTPKNLREERDRRNYHHQYSNSTSVLPQHMNQVSKAEIVREQNLPSTAPSISDNTSFYSTTDINSNSNSNLLMNYPNNSNTNIYQQSIPAQHLVFKTTLRNNDKRGGFGRKHKHEFNEDKPWKNHERGDLNVITSDERKRYEGVFAANKSLYVDLDLRLSDGSETEDEKVLSDFVNTYSNKYERIHGLVVKEIWLRSKLDANTLMKIWSLVLDDRKRKWIRAITNGNKEWLTNEIIVPSLSLNDSNEKINETSEPMNNNNNTSSSSKNEQMTLLVPQPDANENKQHQRKRSEISFNYDLFETDRDLFNDGTLTCEEFIVGMWMIDQCLYGRKMPKLIPATVWETIGVDWKLSNDHHDQKQNHLSYHVPIEIVGMGIKKGTKGVKSTKRGVLKKVIRR